MKKRMLDTMSVAELVTEYGRIGIRQDDALLAGRPSIYNKLYPARHAIKAELTARGAEARLVLAQLLNHTNIQVRLNAGIDSLTVKPAEARTVLREIRASRVGPQCIDAGQILDSLDAGTYTPT